MEYQGKVTNGMVVLEDGPSLPEGTRVRIEPLNEGADNGTLGQQLMKFAGTVTGLPSDMAVNHDHYLHGASKK